MVEGGEPADLAVLSRELGRRRPVPGLRRVAGQQFMGWPVAIPGWHREFAMGKYVRWRRVLDVPGPERSRLSLRGSTGRLRRSGEPLHARAARHSAESELQGKTPLELEHADRSFPERK